MATSWSFSRLGDFEKCRKLFWLKHEQRIPEPERPLPKGRTEHANDRGSRIHDNCEQFVRGDIPTLAPEADKHFGWQLEFMRQLYTEGKVSLEGEWGMDKDWEVTAWKGAWLRLKLDALIHVAEDEAIVIDYKTGRKFGNEVKHAQQLQLYALVTFLRYPELERVSAQLWYLDTNEVTEQTFTRSQSLRFKRNFDKRGNEITDCTDWPANANKFSCQYCLYGPEHSGHCAEGVRKA